MVIFWLVFTLMKGFLMPTYSYNLKSEAYFTFENFKQLSSEPRLTFDKPLSAEGVLVKEFFGQTLYEKNAYQTFPLASLTKILTAYLALDIYEPSQVLTFTPSAIAQSGEVGSFKIGEEVKVIDLIKASLIASSNDSAYLLAENYGLEKFNLLIKEKLKEWNLTQTQIIEPTGLSSHNISTPYEFYFLMLKVFSERPEIFTLTREEKIWINKKLLWNTNLLLGKYSSIIVGGKTGYTHEAGECLALILKFPNSPFVALILFKSEDRFKDAETIIKALAKYYHYEL